LFSSGGVLNVNLKYNTSVDANGRTQFCFTTLNGDLAPTLRVKPGDTININVQNLVPPPPPGAATQIVSDSTNTCGNPLMTTTSMNIHTHGVLVAPQCHEDQVIHTMVNSGESFQYSLHIPEDETPGLYWYHSHVHGIAEAAVQGGASGAIIVDGIANVQPATSGLPQRVLIVRDEVPLNAGPAAPTFDVSLNYVSIPYKKKAPSYTPGILQIKAGQKELWRVANASADTMIDVQLVYDGVAQPLEIVGRDGVPVNSKLGTVQGTAITQTHVLIPTAGRAEFIVTAPSTSVADAVFSTLAVPMGRGGFTNTARPLAKLQALATGPTLPTEVSNGSALPPMRDPPLLQATPTANRTLYFSVSPQAFLITVDGQTPVAFNATNPPAITTTQGSVEDWIIQNRDAAHHEFHMHQIHFLLLEVNGVPVPADQQQYFDMHDIPGWSGTGPFPSIKVRMDFRGPDVGDFVYHCHILFHEDVGMMAKMRVLP
jgi:FtsP/CotA-like multicopper oxidase with cupredoxin domain